MQLQRILSLALLGVAASTVAAYDFEDATRSADNTTSNSVPNDEDRIYGGEEADISKYPWTVSLRKTPEGQTYCGATLVAAQYLVTAAHCVKDVAYASIGSQFSKGTEGGERIKVAQQWVHPKYVKDTHDFDVAVMKLETPSTAKTLPLCKADGSQNKENAMAVVRGWGMTESEVPATTLLEVNVRIISNAVCNKSYKDRITDQMICAGQGGGKDTCQGDSGGALISSNALIGIVSWGGACGVAPGVYVRVSTVLDFINEKIGGGSAASAGSSSNSAPSGNSTTPALTTAAPTPASAPSSPASAPASPASSPASAESGSASQYTSAPKPAATTASPSSGSGTPASTPAAPASTPAAPAATPAAPAATPATPAATPATPASTPATPASTPVPPSTLPAGKTDKGIGGKPGKPGKPSKGTGGGKPKKKDCGVRL